MLNKAKGRMFKSVGWTWTPLAGCTHECPYCYARQLTERWGRDFEPKLRQKTLMDKLPDDGTWIFVGSMGDTFCDGFEDKDIAELFFILNEYKGSNKFLLQTKNPTRLLRWLSTLKKIKDKVIIGTTLETNRATLGRAPPTDERYDALVAFKKLGFKTFLSLEPLEDFDLGVLPLWVYNIQPEAVEIGLENYTKFTVPPPEHKIIDLLRILRHYGFEYVLKENLRHIAEEEEKP